MSLSRALLQSDIHKKSGAVKAAKDEAINLVKNHAIILVHRNTLSKLQLAKIIHGIVFADEKYRADGSFERTKVRACGRGDELDTAEVGDTHAPTVHPSTVMMLIAYITALGREWEWISTDIDGAFLIPPVQPGEAKIHVLFNAAFATFIIETHPHFAEFVEKDGSLLVELGKYLYGLPQAAARFQTHLSASQRLSIILNTTK
jgi:hypothetical protein